MKTIDIRFDKSLLENMIGKEFVKYRCDKFVFTNSITQIVGLYIGDEIYKLTNIQETVDYFGCEEDVAILRLSSCHDEEVTSAFEEVEQIDTPIRGVITSIELINDHQMIYENGTKTYDVWLTRAIIFKIGEYEVLYEKDSFPYSEEINIIRGYDLVSNLSDVKLFLEDWDEKYEPKVEREHIFVAKA